VAEQEVGVAVEVAIVLALLKEDIEAAARVTARVDVAAVEVEEDHEGEAVSVVEADVVDAAASTRLKAEHHHQHQLQLLLLVVSLDFVSYNSRIFHYFTTKVRSLVHLLNGQLFGVKGSESYHCLCYYHRYCDLGWSGVQLAYASQCASDGSFSSLYF